MQIRFLNFRTVRGVMIKYSHSHLSSHPHPSSHLSDLKMPTKIEINKILTVSIKKLTPDLEFVIKCSPQALCRNELSILHPMYYMYYNVLTY